MAKNEKVVFFLKEEVEAKTQILSDVNSELIALADMIKALLSDPEDMEAGTPEGVKILIQKIKGQVRKVLDTN